MKSKSLKQLMIGPLAGQSVKLHHDGDWSGQPEWLTHLYRTGQIKKDPGVRRWDVAVRIAGQVVWLKKFLDDPHGRYFVGKLDLDTGDMVTAVERAIELLTPAPFELKEAA